MLAEERQKKIYEAVKSRGAVTASALSKDLCVSLETVRRDLLFLENAGMLTKVHGGAVAKNDMRPNSPLTQRNSESSAEKRMLSEKAAEFIEEGDVVGIDTGSTAIIFAQVLKERFSELTVVTHSLDVLEILRDHANFNIILLGGQLLASENALTGPLTHDMLSGIHIQKAFIFPAALSLGNGIFDYTASLLEIQREMIKASNKIFILADSSKFEKTALIKTTDMKEEFTYITDSKISGELLKLYQKNNIEIYTK